MTRTSGWLIAIALWALGPSIPAEVLVTRDGQRIETQGPWQVKGRQVVFTSTQGVLSSMRLAEIDLAASEAATAGTAEDAEAAAPAAEPAAAAAEERQPILVMTNDSVRELSSGENPAIGELGDEAAELGRELGEALGEAMAGMTEGMMTGLAEGFGGEADGQQLEGEMADQMAEGMAALGDVMGVAIEMSMLAAVVEERHDLDTAEGMGAAADDFAELGRETRSRLAGASPEAQEMLAELATQFEELADLARRDPAAAVRLRQEKMAQKASEVE